MSIDASNTEGEATEGQAAPTCEELLAMNAEATSMAKLRALNAELIRLLVPATPADPEP